MGVRVKRKGSKIQVETWGNASAVDYVTNIDYILDKMDEYGTNEFVDNRKWSSVYDSSPMTHDMYFSKKNYKK